jgi:primosomal replication protein N
MPLKKAIRRSSQTPAGVYRTVLLSMAIVVAGGQHSNLSLGAARLFPWFSH